MAGSQINFVYLSVTNVCCRLLINMNRSDRDVLKSKHSELVNLKKVGGRDF